MTIHRSASYRVRPGGAARCRAAIERFVARVGGARYYYAMQDADDETRFLHMAGFDDEEARRRHDRRFAEEIGPEVEGAVEHRTWTVVAAQS